MEKNESKKPVRAVAKVDVLFEILRKDEENNKDYSFITFFFRENMHILERRDGNYYFDRKEYQTLKELKEEVIIEGLNLENIKDRITIVNLGTAQNIGPVPVDSEKILEEYLKYPEDVEYHLNMPNRYDVKEKYKKEKSRELIAKGIIYFCAIIIFIYIAFIISSKISEIIK